jgi:flagellar basal-body rod protein FlgB
MLEDVTSSAVHLALDGLAKRQRVTADNVANIETPGFLAGRVQFEDALRQAVASGGVTASSSSDTSDASSVDYTQGTLGMAGDGIERSLEPTRENGNNVNLDHETISNVDTKLRYQLMLRAMDDKFGLLGDVVKS